MCASIFHQWLHEYCRLKPQLSLTCRRNTYPLSPQIIIQQCQIAAPSWPNDISSAADNVMFKNRVQNIECSFGCVTRSAVLLRSNVANILLFNFCEQKFVQFGPIMIAIDCNGLFLLIFEEKWPNYASGPKSGPNSDSFWVHRLFNVCVRVLLCSNATISAKIKMSFIGKEIFFSQNWRLLWILQSIPLPTIHNPIRSTEG